MREVLIRVGEFSALGLGRSAPLCVRYAGRFRERGVPRIRDVGRLSNQRHLTAIPARTDSMDSLLLLHCGM